MPWPDGLVISLSMAWIPFLPVSQGCCYDLPAQCHYCSPGPCQNKSIILQSHSLIMWWERIAGMGPSGHIQLVEAFRLLSVSTWRWQELLNKNSAGLAPAWASHTWFQACLDSCLEHESMANPLFFIVIMISLCNMSTVGLCLSKDWSVM